MKTLKDYLVESEQWHESPAAGDNIGIELDDGTLIETWIMEATEDSVLVDATPEIVTVLEQWATLSDVLLEDTDIDEHGGGIGPKQHWQSMMQEGRGIEFNGRMVDPRSIELDGVHTWDHPDYTDAYVSLARYTDGTELTDQELDAFTQENGDLVNQLAHDQLYEAEYQGRNVPLGKPMRGDVKKFKVYVRDPKSGNVKKVNFGHGGTSARRAGQKTMKIKKSDPARRRSFRARHNCDNPGSRTKARYWSCRKW
jgi:hypothetical protein